jgi:hypothetical protein
VRRQQADGTEERRGIVIDESEMEMKEAEAWGREKPTCND